MIPVLLKDVRGFFNSLTAYLVIGVFLSATGLLVWVFPETSVLEYGYADMTAFFTVSPFVFVFLIPAVTMRSFAEEKKSGTLDLLLSKPVKEWSLVMAKFFSSLLLLVVSLVPTTIYYFTIVSLGSPPGNLDTPGIIGSYLGLVLLGAAFCAIGVWSSSLTSNQIIAFVLAAFSCFVLYQGPDSVAVLLDSGFSLSLKQMGMLEHYDSMGRGMIDSRDVLYFLSVVTLFLLLTKTVISSRRW